MPPVETGFDRQRAGPTTRAPTIPSSGSPTFTNPDMILPYEGERESSTPSPPFKALHLQHAHSQSLPYLPPRNRSATSTPNNSTRTTLPTKNSPVSSENQQSSSRESENGGARSMAPTKSGAQLNSGWIDTRSYRGNGPSRNGIVRSAEDNEERDADSGSTGSASGGIPPRHSTSKNEQEPKSARFRRYTLEETDNRNESRESDYGIEEDQYGPEKERRKMGAIAEEEDEEDAGDGDSDREMLEAERILENAKKRLTSMEGNLSRARTSFRMTPSPAPQLNYHHPFGIHGLHNGSIKPGARPEGRAQTSLAGALLRQRASQDSGSMKLHHSRGLSEIYVSSSLRNDSTAETKLSFRSISALGSTNASGYGASDFSLVNGRHRHKGSTSSISSNVFNNSVHTSEFGADDVPESSSHQDSQPAPKHKKPLSQHKSQRSTDSTSSECSQHGAQSEAPILERRSRQNSKLRTPSPSAGARQWSSGATGYSEYPAHMTPRSGTRSDQQNTDREAVEKISNIDLSRAQETSNFYNARSNVDLEEIDEHPDKSLSPTAEIDREALAEILNEPFDDGDEFLEQGILDEFPPVPPITETMRHEDRLDAFDYEHFILHSVLGNYSNIRTRPESYSSSESTETTRPPTGLSTNAVPTNSGYHERKNSVDSISTSATFATATEGAGFAEEDDDGDYWSGNEGLSQSRRKNRDMAHSQVIARETADNNETQSPDSPTYPGLVSRSATSTPRAFDSTDNSRSETPRADSGFSNRSSTPVRSTPPDSYVEYIISSAMAEETRAHPVTSSDFNNEDIELLKTVVQSISHAGEKLIRASTTDSASGIDGDPISLLRRRLDTARRALDGELDV